MNNQDESLRRKLLSSLKRRLQLEEKLGVEGIERGSELVPPPQEVIDKSLMVAQTAQIKPDVRKSILDHHRPQPSPEPHKKSSTRTRVVTSNLEDHMSKLAQTPFDVPELPVNEKRVHLKEMYEQLKDCTVCKVNPDRIQVVIGGGNPDAEIMFVGEAPGKDEDEQGIPFVGKSGKLLTDIVEKGMKMSREDVYIANVLKCRPPGNRTPNPIEASICGPHLEKQIEIVRPKIICTLGAISMRYLLSLKTGVSMGSMRGKVHEYRGIPLIVTYHPSYLLRDPRQKTKTWEDIKLLLNVIGKQVPS